MLISIVVPIYNAEKFVERCVQSILNQTYADLEIILVNDGSTDQSFEICRDLESKDSRIKIISQFNQGLGAARNSGIRNATGDYICFIDADDAIDKNMMQTYAATVSEHHPEIILTNIKVYKKGNQQYTEIKNDLPYDTLLSKKQIEEFLIQPYYTGNLGIVSSACTKLYQINFLNKHDLWFYENLNRGEDYWFNFFAFQKAESAYCIPNSFYHYYYTEKSMMKRYFSNQFNALLEKRKKTLDLHQFDFPINYKSLNSKFIVLANEFILLKIKTMGIRKACPSLKKELKNSEFISLFQDTLPLKNHVRLIKYFLYKGKTNAALIVYYIWSFKSR